MNQPIISHTRLLIILAGIVAFGAFAIDMYLPALPTMATELGGTSTQLQLTLSIFFTGFCVGMLIYGPLSDHFGRRKLLLSGILLFAVTSAACMFAINAHQLLILRGFQALGCGACVVMARAASRDIFPPTQLHNMMSKMSLVTMMAPLLAPLIGAVCLMLAGWRSIFGVLMSIALIAFYFVYRYIPETLTPDTDRRLHLGDVLRTYGQLLASKKNITLMLCMACAMSGMFAFIGGAPFVYTQVLGYSELEFALLFGSNIVGMSLITSLNLYLLKRFQASSLMIYQSGALLLAGVGLVTMRATGHIEYTVPLVILYVSHVNALCANGMASLLHLHPTNRAGSVSALAVSIQFGLAAVSTSLVATFSHSTAYAMTGVMLLFGVMAFVCAVLQRKMP